MSAWWISVSITKTLVLVPVVMLLAGGFFVGGIQKIEEKEYRIGIGLLLSATVFIIAGIFLQCILAEVIGVA